MKRILAGLALAAVVAVGCNRSEQGGPGVAPRTAPPANIPPRADDVPGTTAAGTFRVSAPVIDWNIKRGARRDMEISIHRGNNFTQPVTLTFKAPAGITVTPAKVTIPAGASEAKIMVEAAATAATGKQTIEVTGTPQTGAPASVTFQVDVVE